MARNITVYQGREDVTTHDATVPPKGASKEAYDAWLKTTLAEQPFNVSLGAESAIRQYWAEPARLLNLTKFVDVDDEGQHIIWSADDFEPVLDQLDELEEHWREMKLSADLVRHLGVRAQHVREAIRIARDVNGVIIIS